MKKSLFSVFAIVFAFGIGETRAQEWRQIQPLVSRCSDLKKIFGETTCSYPVSNFDLGNVSANVTFAGGKKSKNPLVARVILTFKKWVRLADLEANLDVYEFQPDGDLEDSKIYTNYEKGISLTVREVASEKERFVSSAVLFPKRKE